MFNDKRYSEVNREERQFCALLAHSLLASRTCRERFAALVKQRTAVSLDPDEIRVATVRRLINVGERCSV